MKQSVNIIYKILSAASIPRIYHFTMNPSTITILAYHGISNVPINVYDYCFIDEDSFLRQLLYAKKYFKIVRLSHAVEMIRNNSIKEPTMVVTFDDGYQNNYHVAFPILKKLHIPATIFPTTKYIDTNESLWFCNLHKAIADSSKKSIRFHNKVINLRDNVAKAIFSSEIQLFLKTLTQDHCCPR